MCLGRQSFDEVMSRLKRLISKEVREFLDSLNGVGESFTVCIGLFSAHLNDGFIVQNISGEMSTVDTACIDADRTWVISDFGSRRMPVDDKRSLRPVICPGFSIRCVGALSGLTILVDYLYRCDDIDALLDPRLIR